MNSEIEREEVVLTFSVCAGEKVLVIPKKKWEEIWEEKVENAEQYKLNRLINEMEHNVSIKSEDHFLFELHEVCHEVRSA